MKQYIKGKYKRSIFQTDKGYVIGIIKIKETNDESLEEFINKELTFTGYFADLNQDDDYIFYGHIKEHPKYGIQYEVEKSERIKPDDKDGIVEFLSSDLFPGVGEKLAIKIVDTLGINALDKILENKENLRLVPKISEKKIDIIYQILTKYEESHKIVVYLSDLGFNMRDALNIYNKYKSNTIMIVENNIFDIIDEVGFISFIKIDEISKKLGFDFDDIRRVKACIVYIMQQMTFKSGDTYLEYDQIRKNVLNYLKFNIDDEQFTLLLDELRYENKIILDKNMYYLKDIYLSEKTIVDKVKKLLNKEETKYKKFDQILNDLEKIYEIKYNDKQINAIKMSLEKHLLIINGGPGTGKTTIIKAIVDMYQKLNNYSYEELIEKIALLAPTGRASKRMSESTLLPATTIHRFLKWDKETNSFNVDEYHKALNKFIIVDEVSMIDVSLLASLFKGLTDDIKLVLVGDYNQLPSVGPGNVLKDLIESNVIPTIELDLLYRQSKDSYINILANEVKENNLSNFLEKKEDYLFLPCSSDNLKKHLSILCKQVIEKGYDYKRLQVMAPTYVGPNGIDILNKELQNVFNPQDNEKIEIKYGDVIYRENDKILQLVNMPEENVFNGDIGVIRYIIPSHESESKKNEVYVDYDGNIVKYLPTDLVKIKHGFIISIHKSQGSEFEFVMMPICKSYSRMLYRKLIYTGITRAKKKLILIGNKDAFTYAVSNNNEIIRKTNLKNKLQNMYEL